MSTREKKKAMEKLIGSGNIMEKQVWLKISFFSVLKMRRASHKNVYTAMDVSSWKVTAKERSLHKRHKSGTVGRLETL